jgi:site-specific DNA-methyltransferase (adenine-specific)
MTGLFPIVIAMKPLDGNFAENAVKHGVAGLNVDAGRVALETDCRLLKGGTYGGNRGSAVGTSMFGTNHKAVDYPVRQEGRWPANLIVEKCEEVMARFPSSDADNFRCNPTTGKRSFFACRDRSYIHGVRGFPDSGSAARFFYNVEETEDAE